VDLPSDKMVDLSTVFGKHLPEGTINDGFKCLFQQGLGSRVNDERSTEKLKQEDLFESTRANSC
jgi:hypothetical protein